MASSYYITFKDGEHESGDCITFDMSHPTIFRMQLKTCEAAWPWEQIARVEIFKEEKRAPEPIQQSEQEEPPLGLGEWEVLRVTTAPSEGYSELKKFYAKGWRMVSTRLSTNGQNEIMYLERKRA